MADSSTVTPTVETKVEETPKVVEEPTPAPVESKVESSEPAEAPKAIELDAAPVGLAPVSTETKEVEAVPAVSEPVATATKEVEAAPATTFIPETPALEPKEGLVESKDLPVETKTEVPSAEETKALEIPAVKSDSPSFLAKLKGKIEKSMKSKSPKEAPPAKEEPAPAPATEVAPVEAPAPVETPAVVPGPVETPAAAAETTETKPVAATEGKVADKVTEGKTLFNKIKKQFFTKSHSFSGSIPDSKLGVAPTTIPPAPIEEVSKEAEAPLAPPAETPAVEAPAAVTPVAEAPVAETPAETITAPAKTEETATPPTIETTETAAPPATETPTTEPKEEKAAVKSEKPKNNFFKALVRKISGKTHSGSNVPPAAPPATPVVAASA